MEPPRTSSVTSVGVLRQVDCRLAGGVAAADDRHALTAAGQRLGDRGPVEDADADQRVDPVNVEAPVLDAGCHDERLAGDPAAVVERKQPVTVLDWPVRWRRAR